MCATNRFNKTITVPKKYRHSIARAHCTSLSIPKLFCLLFLYNLYQLQVNPLFSQDMVRFMIIRSRLLLNWSVAQRSGGFMSRLPSPTPTMLLLHLCNHVLIYVIIIICYSLFWACMPSWLNDDSNYGGTMVHTYIMYSKCIIKRKFILISICNYGYAPACFNN